MPEPPYGEIADLLRDGSVVPFLGAGVNFGSRQPPDAKWEREDSPFPPSGAELSRFLAEKCSFPGEDERDRNDLAKVSSYFTESCMRNRLNERLGKVFKREFVPCEIHRFLARVETPLLIVTTNYDDLLEKAFQEVGRPYDLVVHASERPEIADSVLWWKSGQDEPEPVPPSRLNVELRTRTVIYKMHGTIDRTNRWDSYVISEEDYVDFLARMTGQTAVPAQFMRHFRPRNFLFLGYGLRDWNLRVVLRNLRTVLPVGRVAASAGWPDSDEEVRSWAIQFRPSDLERELWNARHVKIYDVEINEFAQRLGDRYRK